MTRPHLCAGLPPALRSEEPGECRTAVGFAQQAANGGGGDGGGGARTLALVVLTCFVALGTNVSSFCLIGRTSAITFQVVGRPASYLRTSPSHLSGILRPQGFGT